jgi:hypothetical protein
MNNKRISVATKSRQAVSQSQHRAMHKADEKKKLVLRRKTVGARSEYEPRASKTSQPRAAALTCSMIYT